MRNDGPHAFASHPWSERHPLVRRTTAEPRGFEFFQILHLLERLVPEGAPIGRQGPVHAELVRLRPSLSLSFPAADIEHSEWRAEGAHGRVRITTTFLGLYGSDSPMPAHLTESLLAEMEPDERVREFLDLFHHRILSLLYRVWVKYRYYVTFRPDGSDPISQVMRGILGLGTSHLDEQLRIHPVRLFRYAGLLSQRPRSTAGLIGQLRDFFHGVDFDVEQCVGRWLEIDPGDRNVLGRDKCSLGHDLLLGERIYDRSGKFRIQVGPVAFDQYVDFLPPGKAAADMRTLAEFYCGDPLAFDYAVTLRADEVPETPLGDFGMLGRLSWTSWLKSAPSREQAVVFR
jgi:type VI secretion system protein ImpH